MEEINFALEEINFALIADQLIAALGPLVATFVATLMGTEVFKRWFPGASPRTVTWAVWGVVALIVWLILNWLPFWVVLILLFLTAGGYSLVIEPLLKRFGVSAKKADKDTPIGGGGGGPVRYR